MAYQQQKCAPHGSGSCVQCKFKAAAGSRLDESRLPGSQTDGSLCLQVAEGEEILWDLIYQSSDPIYDDKVVYQISPQVTSHWGLGFKADTTERLN